MANLYRHFDAAGRLLYVGLSLNAVARLAKHRQASHWFDDIARVEIEWHKSREHAAYAEALAIHNENPLHNIAKPIPRDPDEPPAPPRIKIPRTKLPPDPVAEALKACPVLPVAFDRDGPRTLGYLCVARRFLNRAIAGMRKAGVADELMLIDVVDYGGREQPNLIRLLRMAQHEGTRIMCNWRGDFDVAKELLRKRGVTVCEIPRH